MALNKPILRVLEGVILGEFLPLGSLGINRTKLPTICLGKIKAHDLVQPSSLVVPQLALIPFDEESCHVE